MFQLRMKQLKSELKRVRGRLEKEKEKKEAIEKEIGV